MKPPPHLVGAALLLWGWQSGLWWAAVPLAIAIEAAAFSRARWEFAQADLDRVWDLCAGLNGAFLIYLFASNERGLGLGPWVLNGDRPNVTGSRTLESIRQLFQWFPIWMAPMMLAQVWGNRDRLPVSTFSWYYRRERAVRAETSRPEYLFNIEWIYFAFVVAGISAGRKAASLPFALAIVATWALWSHRNLHFRFATWAAGCALAGVLALSGFLALRPATAWIRSLESQWLNEWLERRPNPNETRTAIGSVGRMKQSGRIVFRIETEPGSPMPGLLREAVYDSYRNGTWVNAARQKFADAGMSEDGTFSFQVAKAAGHSYRLWLNRADSRLLPLPSSVARLDQLPAAALETNQLGVANALGLTFGAFRTVHGFDNAIDPAPQAADLAIPENERAVIERVASDLDLSPNHVAKERAARIAEFFLAHFNYSLYQPGQPGRRPAVTLQRFLLEDRRGHCEYFATATTLLLRAAGIPARYAVGWSPPRSQGISTAVRSRHAHSWTLAWFDGTWHEIDNTPSSWAAFEAAEKSTWEPVRDAWSRLLFEWNRFRQSNVVWRNWLLVGGMVILGPLVFEVWRRRSWRRGQRPGIGTVTTVWPGVDSDFYNVERHLRRAGFERHPGETLLRWLERLRLLAPGRVESLSDLLRLHYRLRFDPEGLSSQERELLRHQSVEWLRRQ